MIHVCTGSRLHFGMLSLAAAGGEAPVPPRYWGGVGVMAADPGLELAGRPAPTWLADGEAGERIVHFATQFAQNVGTTSGGRPGPALHFTAARTSPEHRGLGTGTQLALAVARLVAEFWELPDRSAPALARLVGRGARSAVGIHGFDRGGFLVEAGKAQADEIAPQVARVPFPELWRLVLVIPRRLQGASGERERQALQRLQEQHDESRLDQLCRLVLLGMLPALVGGDVRAFGEAVFEFNRRVGEVFAPVQGGVYSHPGSEEIVQFVRDQGVPGVGQSSWGPTLFAVTAHPEQARDLAARVRARFGLGPDEVLVTAAVNRGAQVVRR